jgi:Flp pilus assembly protein TadD
MAARLAASVLFCIALPLLAADDHGARLNEAKQAFVRGEVPASEHILYEILSYDPTDAAAYELLGQALDAQKRYPEAGAAYRRAMQLGRLTATLLNKYANHQLSVGDRNGARATHLKAVSIDAR